MDRVAVGVLAVLTSIVLAGLHTTPTFYTSDAQSYYDQAELLQDGRITSETRVRGWIPLNGSYSTPHSPGYPVLSLPIATAVQQISIYESADYDVAGGFRRDTYDLYRSSHLMGLNGSLDVRDGAIVYMKSLWEPQEVRITTDHGSRTITLDQNGTMVNLTQASGVIDLQAEQCWQLGVLAPKPVYSQCASIGIGLEDDTHVDLQLWPKTLTLTTNQTLPINITDPGLYRLRFRARAVNTPGTLRVDGKTYNIPTTGRIIITGRRYQEHTNITITNGPITITYLSEKVDRLFHPHTTHQYRLDGTWYLEETSGLRWASDNGTMIFRRPVSRAVIDLRTYGDHQLWLQYHNTTQQVTTNGPTSTIIDPTQPIHQLRLRTDGCSIPAVQHPQTSNDHRCLAYGYQDLRLEYVNETGTSVP